MGRVVQLELLALSRLYLLLRQRTGVKICSVRQRLTVGNIDAVLILLIFDLIQGDRAVGGVAAELDALVEGYGKENVGVGTLIAPADLWTAKELRHANGIDNEDYIDVEATVGFPLETNGDYSIYAGSVINIKERNYNRDFIAVGYIKVITDDGPIYIYSDVVAQKSISEIAEAAYNDVWASQEGKYQHKIEVETDIHYGKWSKYTKEQRNVLYSYIANKDESKNDPFGSDKFDPI